MNTSSRWVRWAHALVLALHSLSCRHHEHEPAHDHGHAHGPSGEHAEAAEEESPTLSLTRWTADHELFVEFPAPRPGQPVPYHAHVTRLDGFAPVTEGTFKVRFKTGGAVAREAMQVGVERPGIFVFEGAAPGAGSYALEMEYEHAGKKDVFDCGTVTVSETPAPVAESSASTISFLKESQWKVPFATAWVEERALASDLELSATVEPAAADLLTVGAPTEGRFFHSQKLSLAEGLQIRKGDVLGSILPTVAGDDYSRLQFAVEEARLAKSQLEREITRVQGLVEQKLLPERRLTELQNELEAETARLASASARIGRVNAPGGAGGLTIKSTLDGMISQVLVPNGEQVAAGAPLLRIGGSDRLWLRARFVAKPASLLANATPTAVRLQTGEQLTLNPSEARLLSSLPVVDPSSRIATWIIEVTPPAATPVDRASSTELRPGASVVVTLRIGVPQLLPAVPRAAVVEINTRSYVFVQVDGEHFEKRRVTLGRHDGPWVEVVSGVAKGDRIVTRGGFDIHLASLLGSVESHRH